MTDDKRFTLQTGRWYAMMLLGDEFDASAMCYLSPSPVHISKVTPLKTGQGAFTLEFFHANYPAGVQDKEYTFHTIHRGKTGLLACASTYDPPRFAYFTDVTTEWLKHNFPHYECNGMAAADFLNRLFG